MSAEVTSSLVHTIDNVRFISVPMVFKGHFALFNHYYIKITVLVTDRLVEDGGEF